MKIRTASTSESKRNRLARVLRLPQSVIARLRAWHIMPQHQRGSRVWLAGDQGDYGNDEEEWSDGEEITGVWEKRSRRMLG